MFFYCLADAEDCTVRCKWLKWFSEKMMCHPCNWTPSVISTNLQLKNGSSDKWPHKSFLLLLDPITEPGTVLWLPRPFLIMRIYCHYNSKPDSSVTIHSQGLCSIFIDNKTRWTKCRDAPRITPLPFNKVGCHWCCRPVVHTKWPGPHKWGPVTLEEPLCLGPSPRLDRYTPGYGLCFLASLS